MLKFPLRNALLQCLSLSSIFFSVLLPTHASALICADRPHTCLPGESLYFAPTESEICPGGGYYCVAKQQEARQQPAAAKPFAETTQIPQPKLLFAPRLSIGSSGAGVMELQKRLIQFGFLESDAVTGYFGPRTFAALKAFQSDNGLEPVGYVGPRTKKALDEATKTLAAQAHSSYSENAGVVNQPDTTSIPSLSGQGDVTSSAPPQSLLEKLQAQINELVAQIAVLRRSVTEEVGPRVLNSLPATCPQIVTPHCPDGALVSQGNDAEGCARSPLCFKTATCAPLPQETRTVSCPAGQTGVITEVRTSVCVGSSSTPSWNSWVGKSNTCVIPTTEQQQLATCKFNTNTLSSGQTVTAFIKSSVSYGGTCQQETRTCANGVLSGSFTFPSCTVVAAASCQLGAKVIAHGDTVIAYQASSVPAGALCTSQPRICTDGLLSGTYSFSSCTVQQTPVISQTATQANADVIFNGTNEYPQYSIKYGKNYYVNVSRIPANVTISSGTTVLILNSLTIDGILHGESNSAILMIPIGTGVTVTPKTSTGQIKIDPPGDEAFMSTTFPGSNFKLSNTPIYSQTSVSSVVQRPNPGFLGTDYLFQKYPLEIKTTQNLANLSTFWSTSNIGNAGQIVAMSFKPNFSFDYGKTFTAQPPVDPALSGTSNNVTTQFMATAQGGRKLITATSGCESGDNFSVHPCNSYKDTGYIYISHDSGVTWQKNTAAGQHAWVNVGISEDGNTMVAAHLGVRRYASGTSVPTPGGLYISKDGGATWRLVEAVGKHEWKTMIPIYVSGNGEKIIAQGMGGGTDSAPYLVNYYSSDGGSTWTNIWKYPEWTPNRIAGNSDGSFLVATPADTLNHPSEPRISTDFGRTWRPAGNFLTAVPQSAPLKYMIDWDIKMSADGTTIVTGSTIGYIYVSRDRGATWKVYDPAVPTTVKVMQFNFGVSSDGSHVFAVDFDKSVYIGSLRSVTINDSDVKKYTASALAAIIDFLTLYLRGMF